MQIRNICPLGAVEVPSLGLMFDAGETCDVTAEQASALLPQAANFEPADDEARTLLDSLGGHA